jgi:hypothetical protein
MRQNVSRSDVSENDLGVVRGLSDNTIGWNAGGGLMIFVADHFGFRGDLRHFHSFEDLDFVLELQRRSWRSGARPRAWCSAFEASKQARLQLAAAVVQVARHLR